jgi:hypothetical protein
MKAIAEKAACNQVSSLTSLADTLSNIVNQADIGLVQL